MQMDFLLTDANMRHLMNSEAFDQSHFKANMDVLCNVGIKKVM